MGFYHRSTRLSTFADGIRPVITPREYTTLFADAGRMVMDRTPQESDIHCARIAVAAAPGVLAALSRRARRHPDDSAVHRALGIAHLSVGNCRKAVRHLEIAVDLLLAQAATRGCLHQTLSARLQLALLLPVLVPLFLRCGRRETARRLISEALVA